MALIDEINAKCTPELIASRNDVAIAAAVNEGRTRIDALEKFSSLGISERFPSIGGLPGPLAAESVFQKLEQFAAFAIAGEDPAERFLGGAIVRQMKHLEGSGMAIGSPAVAAMLAQIVTMGGLTQEEMEGLIGVAAVPDPVSVSAVSDALNAAQGLLTLEGLNHGQ